MPLFCDLRKSLDLALQLEKMLQISLAVLGTMLKKEPALADDFTVLIAEFYNQYVGQMAHLQMMIQGLTEEIKIFGEKGMEKQLVFMEEEDDGS